MSILGAGAKALLGGGEAKAAERAVAARQVNRNTTNIKRVLGGKVAPLPDVAAKPGLTDRMGASLGEEAEKIRAATKEPSARSARDQRVLNAAEIHAKATADGGTLGVKNTAKILWNTDRGKMVTAGVGAVGLGAVALAPKKRAPKGQAARPRRNAPQQNAPAARSNAAAAQQPAPGQPPQF